MKVLILAVLFCASAVFGQNPYEYVDDALLQRVGQIIFEYDQKVAASRSAGGGSSSYSNTNTYSQNGGASARSIGGYQQSQPQRVSQVPNVNYNNNYRSQRQYNQMAPAAPVQQQQNYQVNRNQRQYNPVSARSSPSYQQQQTGRMQRQLPAPLVAQAPSVAQTRAYQEPQVSQKSGLSGYVLSQPEPVQMVAEWHYVDGVEDPNYLRNFGNGNRNGNNRYSGLNGNNNEGFRLV